MVMIIEKNQYQWQFHNFDIAIPRYEKDLILELFLDFYTSCKYMRDFSLL